MKNPFSKEEREKRYRARVRRAIKKLRAKNSEARLNERRQGIDFSWDAGFYLSPREQKRFTKLRMLNNSWLTWGDDVTGIRFKPDKRSALNRISDAALGIDPDKRLQWVRESDARLRQQPYEPKIEVTFWNQVTGQIQKDMRSISPSIALYNGDTKHPSMNYDSRRNLNDAGRYRWEQWTKYGEDWKSHVPDYVAPEPVEDDDDTDSSTES